MQGLTQNNCNQIIRNFATMSVEQISSVGKNYGLAMSVSELNVCRTMFADYAINDITSEELYLIDRLSSSANFLPEQVVLDKFVCDNSYIQSTYSDAKTKVAAIRKEKDCNPSVYDLMSIASKYLCQANKKIDIIPPLTVSSDNSKVKRFLKGLFYANQPVVVSDKSKYSGIYRKSQNMISKPIPDRAYILLVYPSKDMDKDQFEDKILGLIASKAIMNNICDADIIGRTGIAGYVLKYGKNSLSDINNYPEFCHDISFAEASSSFQGSLILTVPTNFEHEIIANATEIGLNAFRAAAINENKKCMFRVDKNNKSVIYLKSKLVSSLSLMTLHNVSIPQLSAIDAHVSPVKSEKIHPVMGDASDTLFNVYTCGDYGVSAVSTKVGINPFLSSFYAVIGAYMNLIVHGYDKNSIIASLNGSLPYSKKGDSFADTIATILGIYRAQSELSLPSLGSNISFEKDGNSITIFSFARKYIRQIPEQFQNADSKVYLLSPKFNEDGMVDTEDLRSMIMYLSHIIDNDLIFSARTTCGSSICEIIESMTFEDRTFKSFESYDLNSCPNIGVIVEAKSDIHGVLLGQINSSIVDDKNEKSSIEPKNEALDSDLHS